MASRQEKGEERAEEAAREETASDINRQKMESRDREYYDQGEQERPGVIGTILKSVAETLESAKEAVIGKSYDEPREGGYEAEEEEEEEEERGVTDRAAEKAGETKEAAKEKTETAMEKAMETAESAAEKANRAKETVREKAKETMESAAEKARQAKETDRR